MTPAPACGPLAGPADGAGPVRRLPGHPEEPPRRDIVQTDPFLPHTAGGDDGTPGQPWQPPQEPPSPDGGSPEGDGKHRK